MVVIIIQAAGCFRLFGAGVINELGAIETVLILRIDGVVRQNGNWR